MTRLFRKKRVVHLQQLDSFSCGATCLAMILNHHGFSISVKDCCAAFNIGRDGLTAQTIAQAARKFGLRVQGYSINIADLKRLTLPAIAHWNFNHFVVVEQYSSTQVVIVDPSIGRCKLSIAEFSRSFTGVVLCFEPGVHFPPQELQNDRAKHKQLPTWQRYLQQFLLTRRNINVGVQIFITSLLLQGLGLALPLITQVLVDRILPHQQVQMMPILGIGIALLALTQLVANYLRSALLIYWHGHLDAQMMLGAFEHLLSLPFQFFQMHTSGDLLMRLGSIVVIRDTLSLQTLALALDAPFVALYLLILWVRDPIFALLVLALGWLQMLIVLLTNHQVHELTQKNLATQADSQSYVVEALAGIATIKASGAEDRVLERWTTLFFKQLNASLQSNHLSAVTDTLMGVIRTFAPLVLLWVGALRVLEGSMSLGTMLALNAIALLFLAPLSSLVLNVQKLQIVGAYLGRLADILDTQPEQPPQIVAPVPRLTGQIELKNVNFRYAQDAPWALKNLSLTVQSGQKVALVGRSGSGKSTLAKLLLGLYLPTEGDILYDNISLQTLNLRRVRDQIGVVLQESVVFQGSIRQNIAFNDPTLDLPAIVVAAQLAAIHDEILAMPMGYETLLAEGGSGLSGGQLQRLLLARAFATRPKILLLDEATSHLDAVAESIVNRNLNQLVSTQVVIAHRLSTIRDADQIFVLNQGQIVEQGTHDELLTYDGYYVKLLKNQLIPIP